MAHVLCYRVPCLRGVWSDQHFAWHRRPQRTVAMAVVDSVTSSEQEHKGVQFTLAIGAKFMPHPDKIEKGGEDAFFASSFDGGLLAIADGVSGWADENVDPALYSKEFMKHLEDGAAVEEARSNPKEMLRLAHAATTAIGAATVIVAKLLSQEGLLRVANVGDCGLRIVRDGKMLFATSPQQHYLDCPFQFSSDEAGQTAEDAAIYEINVEEGDVIVMGSDGLFDNVHDREIAATVNLFNGKDQETATKAAARLAALANRNSMDTTYESPYSIEARFQGMDLPFWKKLLGQKLTGGKLDDITVLVGLVGTSEASASQFGDDQSLPAEEANNSETIQ